MLPNCIVRKMMRRDVSIANVKGIEPNFFMANFSVSPTKTLFI